MQQMWQAMSTLQHKNQNNDTIEEYLKKVQQSWKHTHDIHNILVIFGIKPAQTYFNHIDYQTIKPD